MPLCVCRQERVLGYFKGLTPYLLHVTPSVCIIFLVYEKVAQLMAVSKSDSAAFRLDKDLDDDKCWQLLIFFQNTMFSVGCGFISVRVGNTYIINVCYGEGWKKKPIWKRAIPFMKGAYVNVNSSLWHESKLPRSFLVICNADKFIWM